MCLDREVAMAMIADCSRLVQPRRQRQRPSGCLRRVVLALLGLLLLLQTGECHMKGNSNTRLRQHLMSRDNDADPHRKQVHIVYMGGNPEGHSQSKLREGHVSTLAWVRSVHGQTEEVGAGDLLHSYSRTLNGFAASLSPDEAETMSGMAGVVSVFPSTIRTVSTTRSWQFMGLSADASTGSATGAGGLWDADHAGKHVIIGLLDTGIWPESRSFRDSSSSSSDPADAMPAAPARWKGQCAPGDANFNASTCNRKLIGGRFYAAGYEAQIGADIPRGYRSARDGSGHGTHTASTAAGRPVPGANMFGLAAGAARGGAPLAHVAMYKVCWASEASAHETMCTDADILAAVDDAVADGVDVLSVSLNAMVPPGVAAPPDYLRDALAVGCLHAAVAGVAVAASAGNQGAGGAQGTVTNGAPWVTTVAASSIDRQFPASLALGDGAVFPGAAINDGTLARRRWFPLVAGADASDWGAGGEAFAAVCADGTLDGAKVRGSIVYCRSSGPGYDSYTGPVQAGAVGMVWPNVNGDGPAEAYVYDIPTAKVEPGAEAAILQYINSTKSPVATISQPTTLVNFSPAPMMASFSSQGPNLVQPEILKPDLTAPGVDILASWTPTNPPTEEIGGTDTRSEEFNIISGTSMSAPHVAALFALLKSVHPTWSPAAIRSALMTTASVVDKRNHPIQDHTGRSPAGPFHYGSGHVAPTAAADPGLVYDASAADYALFLCARYDTATVRRVTGDARASCPAKRPDPHNLNYPSLALPRMGVNTTRTVRRTLTWVTGAGGGSGGNATSGNGTTVTYRPEVRAPAGVSVAVAPRELTFRRLGDRAAFTVTVTPGPAAVAGAYLFGEIVWTDGRHRVRAPLAVQVHTR